MRSRLLGNLGAKLGAVLLATLLWFHVVTNRSYEQVLQVPLDVDYVSERLIVANQVPKSIPVKFSGQGRQLLQLRYSDLKALLRVNSDREGKKKFTLSISDIKIPTGLVVKALEITGPKIVIIDFDQLMDKKLRVIPQVSLQLADGYAQVGPIHSEPDSIQVSGPRRFVRGLKSVLLDSIKLSKVRKDVIETVRAIPPEGEHIKCQPGEVALKIDVQALGERWISDIPVDLKYPPRGIKARVEPSTIALKVKGGKDLLATLKPEDFSVYIDYRRIRRTRSRELPAEISSPPEVEWIEARPERFTLVRQ